jgi:transcription elongation factor GreB
MSKAFLRESDLPDPPERLRRATQLPAGAMNYLTAAGARLLRGELERLEQVERPRLARASPIERGNDERLQALDRRIYDLKESLRSAQVVDPPTEAQVRARFGARVTVRSPGGEESTYRLVGVDETRHDPNNISWVSPVGKALLNSTPGQKIAVQTPSGKREFLVVRIENG